MSVLRGLRWCLIACWLLAGAGLAVTAAAAPSSVLVLGRISDDPATHYNQLKPLLDYVVPRMHEVGIRRGEILMAPDAGQMSSYLRRGRVDWVSETTGAAMLLEQRGSAHPLLMTERGGLRDFHTLFFVRRDSPIQSFGQLRGHTLALQNASSTSGYLLPMLELLRNGIACDVLLSADDTPVSGSVGYLMVGSKLNVAAFVHKQLIDVGALSNVGWDDERHLPPVFKRDFRIVHRTAPVPRAVEMVRAGMEPAVEQRLRVVLLQAASDPKAGPALKRFFDTTGFHALDATSRRRLQELSAGVQRVRDHVE
ncbi:phosphate/phosphite/phosphonate ABC transporter substrate-binding protein [Xanthomonas nasturtii]|uniref:Phosphate/phosphite/phosphonate ABC transporter substrate-binding protein n=1 Tax=Xanthomonas nasturtii TaxID=1843581 RepID=A0ABT0LMH9_9XANT|nr:phosphate/phosphite/phosphonate ABC transporter substrate-binding protein [Xanthomonas nasturtii]MCL1532887.1 phosphate/phosphite/phosphonate ABC transporter substrate-binding protein [Xanthomonas nasturtii]MCL1542558.1 phosphate/phosphite/phosphonate ABC transporter substrate-binding protein [Xanthomonas nasturtii]MCL1550124.1 phosphate/phosphite/phosphonate ABC transporter substrate-binding protein [Xanthomonas nasturtii]MCL1554209.1 phosphate/phosphite/phosphonate ABC transporter substrat